MPDPENRRAALIASACLIGPTIPSALVVNRPHEAATALTRMADLLEPWLDVSTTALPGTAATATASGVPETGEEAQHDRSEGSRP